MQKPYKTNKKINNTIQNYKAMNLNIRETIQELLAQETDTEHMLLRVQQAIGEYNKNMQTHAVIEPLQSVFTSCVESIEQGKSPILCNTGFTHVDSVLAGCVAGEFIVLGGRTGMGKSQLAMILSLRMAQQVPVMFVSYDYSMPLLGKKYISILADVPFSDLISESISPNVLNRVHEAEKLLNNYSLVLQSPTHTKISSLCASIRSAVETQGIKVVYIDYIQLLKADMFMKIRDAELGFIIRELKQLAKELGICIIALSQLSRMVENRVGNKHPMLSDLRESGSLEQDADVVIGMHRPEYFGIDISEDGESTLNLIELLILKHKLGNTGIVRMKKNKAFTHIEDFSSPDFEIPNLENFFK